jgi:hypothetical protein
MIPFTDNVTMLNAVTTAGANVSGIADISKRQQATLQFICTGHSSGHGVFTVDASNDNVSWTTGIAFLDAKQTTVGTSVASKTLSANGTQGAYLTPGWRYIRVNCAVTTDGTYTAILQCGG